MYSVEVKTSPSLQSKSSKRSGYVVFVWLLLIMMSAVLVISDRAPEPVPASANEKAFSAERALQSLSVIGRAPHPVNSPEHDRVRDYILQRLSVLDVQARVQSSTSASELVNIGGRLENIVCRLKGSSSKKAVMVVAHYDSVPAGPGASDDSVAVAAMLETLRALKTSPPLRRDVIFLFTDGEEAGLLGAKAFILEDPWAHDVGVVLNFEARGISGPSIMFETSDQNRWLIQQMALAAPFPVANSLSFEIYKRLPNDTDFTIFKHAGYSGLNFAFIDGLAYYHTALDSLGNIHLSSLQHHGDSMLSLSRRFGDALLDDPKDGNSVYFDVLGRVLLYYSAHTAFLLLALITLGMFVLISRGVLSGEVRLPMVALTFVIAVAALCSAALGTFAVSTAVTALAPVSTLIHAGLLFDPGFYVLAECAVGIACAMAICASITRHVGEAEFTAGTLFACYLVAAMTAFYVPGGSYLFELPLIFSLVGWLIVGTVKRLSSVASMSVPICASLPGLILIVPMAHKIFFAFASVSGVIVVSLAMLLLFLSPAPLCTGYYRHKWAIPGLLLLLGVVIFLAALVQSAGDRHLLVDSGMAAMISHSEPGS